MDIVDLIRSLSERHYEEVVAIRRHLHSHPELSFREFNTSEYISTYLHKLGIPYHTIADTGIIGLIHGGKADKTVALRADMDALPIEEKNETSYKSQNHGVMHACGHDVHCASLLGTAMILSESKEKWNGTVKLIFQPGEEKLPGGATMIIDQGGLENPHPAALLAQHVFPSLETGKVGFHAGTYMASCDEIYMSVKGKGGHAAMPAEYNNPILIASKIVVELENMFMSHPRLQNPSVLAFGKMEASGTTNVIPEKVYMEGTFRTMDEKWRITAHEMIEDISHSVAKVNKGDCEVNIVKGYPVLINNEALTLGAEKSAIEYLGENNVVKLEKRMTSEDFAWYTHKIPSCFYRLGTGNRSKGIISGVHTPTFDIDENALKTSTGLMAWLAIKELGKS